MNDGGGASSFDGPITLTGANTVRTEAALRITGAIGGGGGFTKTGVGTLTVTTPVAYTGDTTVAAGTLALTTASTFADASAIRLTTGAVLSLGVTGTDQVAELYIDTVKQSNGKWGRIGSIAALGATYESALITGDGLLQVGAASSPFELWATAKGLDGTPGKENTPTADPDGDGRSNLTEFAFDGNPLSGSDHGKVFVFTADSSDAGTAAELVLTAAVRKTAPAFSGTPSPTATADGITYLIEGGTNLTGFSNNVTPVDPITAGLPTPGADYEYRSFSLDSSNGLPGTGFLRAKVTAP
jgi:autotransporter-associated beta strand protein